MFADQLGGLGFLLIDSKKSKSIRKFPPGEDISPERLLIGQRSFLIDGFDTQLPGAFDGMSGNFFSFIVDFSCSGRVNAGNKLNQGRFAGAVVTPLGR